MGKARSSKGKSGGFQWINTNLELPPTGVRYDSPSIQGVNSRPVKVGNNTTGSKGKLKCAGCRFSKIKVAKPVNESD
jgi:hypothetical protein